MSFALTFDADLTTTTLGDGFADGQSETRPLYEIVQLDKAVKDKCLFLLGDAGAGILAIDIQSLAAPVSFFQPIAHLDISVVGVLHRVGHEVGDNLLQALAIRTGRTRGVWIVLDEHDVGLGNALRDGMTHLVEERGEVETDRYDALRFLAQDRGRNCAG